MSAILVIGPSHAGKSTLTRSTAKHLNLGYVNLDEALGESHRSDGQAACEIIEIRARCAELVMIDCGAGLLAFSSVFRAYVSSRSAATIAVWCNEVTFRQRHSVETGENEVANNYSGELKQLWERVRDSGRLVDTSSGVSCAGSLERMVSVVSTMIANEAWITA